MDTRFNHFKSLVSSVNHASSFNITHNNIDFMIGRIGYWDYLETIKQKQ